MALLAHLKRAQSLSVSAVLCLDRASVPLKPDCGPGRRVELSPLLVLVFQPLAPLLTGLGRG